MSRKKSVAGSRWSTLTRIARYSAFRLAALIFTAATGVFLTIIIANMGGHLDDIRKARIEDEATQQMMMDPETQMMPDTDRREIIEQMVQTEIRRQGLDRPFWQRLPGDLWSAVRLDLGRARDMTSPSHSREVSRIIIEHLPATLLLFATANFMVFFAALGLALILSRRYGSLADRAVIAMAPSSAAPGWFYGIFLILIFAYLVPDWMRLPDGGMVGDRVPEGTLAYAGTVLKHMILPVGAMFLSAIFISIYKWRTFFLIHSSEDYVEMAKAKGLSSRAIERRYILRPTLPPIVTSFALMLIALWSGAIILERVFNWPGLGTALYSAIQHQETNVIVGLVVVFAYLLAVTVFLLDIVYALLDPRVKLGEGGGRQ